MTVSILIPFYNSQLYLKQCIDSVLNQTYRDFEIILLNDGSTDDSESIVKSYNDPRIKYYKNEKNMGVGFTGNRLIELAQNEYCLRLDSDDISLPQRVEEQVRFMDEHPDVALVGAWIKLYNNFQPHTLKQKIIKFIVSWGWVWCQPVEVTLKKILRANAVMHSTFCFRKSKVTKHNIKYKYNYCDDYDFIFQFLAAGLKVMNIPKVLVLYCYGLSSNLSSHKKQMKELDATVKSSIRNYMHLKEGIKYPYWLNILQKLRPSLLLKVIKKC